MVNYLAKPWLALPSSLAHDLAIKSLSLCSHIYNSPTPEWSPLTWRGLHFKNPLGISGGVDKDCDYINCWWRLGPGFLEVGTITPEPQPGNSGSVIDRQNNRHAVWNRMGFPSKGLEHSFLKIKELPQDRPTPIFANVGKNATTPLEEAHKDYVKCIRRLKDHVDGFVVNISSPNTKGLRELLKKERLSGFLSPILDSLKGSTCPLLLKLSPDMEDEDLTQALDTSNDLGVDGWILTNTSVRIRDGLKFPNEGGVSGAPLTQRSRQCLELAVNHLGERKKGKLLVSSGGVMNFGEIQRRLEIGADLVQVYSTLVFEGPSFFHRMGREAKKVIST